MANKIALVTKMKGQLVKQAGPAQVAGSLSDLVNAWKNYQTIREGEITKRTQIAADRDARLAAIQAQADTFHKLIDKTFDERSNNFDQFFDLLEKCFSNNDDRQINAALTMIVEQVRVSPMAQAVQMMKQINDPDVEYIDI